MQLVVLQKRNPDHKSFFMDSKVNLVFSPKGGIIFIILNIVSALHYLQYSHCLLRGVHYTPKAVNNPVLFSARRHFFLSSKIIYWTNILEMITRNKAATTLLTKCAEMWERLMVNFLPTFFKTLFKSLFHSHSSPTPPFLSPLPSPELTLHHHI